MPKRTHLVACFRQGPLLANVGTLALHALHFQHFRKEVHLKSYWNHLATHPTSYRNAPNAYRYHLCKESFKNLPPQWPCYVYTYKIQCNFNTRHTNPNGSHARTSRNHRNHARNHVTSLQNVGNLKNHIFWNHLGTIGTTSGTTSTYGKLRLRLRFFCIPYLLNIILI